MRSSRVLVDENVKGGTIDLRIRNSSSGTQGTPNVRPDRKAQGRPKNADKSESAPTYTSLPDNRPIPQVVIRLFIPPPHVQAFDEEDAPVPISPAKPNKHFDFPGPACQIKHPARTSAVTAFVATSANSY